jgi:PBSX family phage portal protein
MSAEQMTAADAKLEAFTFGDPEPVLNRRQVLDMVECYHNGRWYEPPVPLDALARSFDASPHHSSAIILKRNQLMAALKPNPLLSPNEFAGLVMDYLIFGNCFPEMVLNRLGGPLRIRRSLARYTRVGVDDGPFWWVPGLKQETAFADGSVLQIAQPGINQEIYGLPEYMSALQSIFLNENATLFRRRYYLNGAHAGYILYATGDFAEGDVDTLRDQLKAAKGPGNFRNLFVHAPGGKAEGIKIIPIADAAAKDEFLGIKGTSRDDILAAHRVPPQLLGIVPANAGGFGDITKASDAFWELEMWPLAKIFLVINTWAGREVVAYEPRPERVAAPTPAAAA